MTHTPAAARPSSGSPFFDALRDRLGSDRALTIQVQDALATLVNEVNVSDRGSRWVAGAVVEWILAAAAYAVGIVTFPRGAGADGVDLEFIRDEFNKALSVKASFSKTATYRISNGMAGSGKGFTDPTVFLHPRLGGIVFADPATHRDLAASAQQTADAVVISIKAVREHATAHPECVIPLEIPYNLGRGTSDPGTEFSRQMLNRPAFPQLGRVFEAAAALAAGPSLADEILKLRALRDAGDLTPEQYKGAVGKVTASA